MSKIICKEIKRAIGYTEEQNKCEDCKYVDEWKDQFGIWVWSCNYSNACSFNVKKQAHCDKFEKRIKP